jgi:hypothetical protein
MQAASNAVIALPPTTMEIVDLNSDIADHMREVQHRFLEQQDGQAIGHMGLLDDEDPHATFFSFARKYQPNSEIRTHTPPKLPCTVVQVVSCCFCMQLFALHGITCLMQSCCSTVARDLINGIAGAFL